MGAILFRSLSSIFVCFLSVSAFANIVPHLATSELSVSTYHTCAITEAGVKCWGKNDKGQTNVPVGLNNPRNIVTGYAYSCVIVDEGIRCWGDNDSRQLNVPPNMTHPSQIFAGGGIMCAIQDQALSCWGDSNGAETNRYPQIPKNLPPAKSFAITAGMYGYSYHHCALFSDRVECWGNNDRGQASAPADLKNPREIAIGDNHSCAIGDSGVRCWGDNSYGQLDVPKDLNRPRNLVARDSGTCVITDDGLRCWGLVLGENQKISSDLKNPSFVAFNGYRMCAMTNDGVKCWSPDFSFPEFAKDQIKANLVPDGFNNATTLVADKSRQCVIADEGIRCWSSYGPLIGFSSLAKPQEIALLNDGNYCVVASSDQVQCWKVDELNRTFAQKTYSGWNNARNLTGGWLHFCAITDDGVKCQGDDRYGQSTPPADLKNPKSLSLSDWSSCAATDDGIRCWGAPISYAGDFSGKIGNVTQIAYNHDFNHRGSSLCAIVDSDVKCWGMKFDGKNGIVMPANLKGATEITANHGSICAIVNQSVQCWGNNGFGQISDVPVILKNPRHVSIGESETCAITDDGVKCWAMARPYPYRSPIFDYALTW